MTLATFTSRCGAHLRVTSTVALANPSYSASSAGISKRVRVDINARYRQRYARGDATAGTLSFLRI
ncbi:MAG: hypothetical protein WBB07_12365 [Mycobacterium sp.]